MIKQGNTVSVHYTGKHTNGRVFDSSVGGQPLQFEVGAGMMIKGFDDAVLGMKVGEKKTILIPAKDGYGESNPQNIFDFNRLDIPDDVPLVVGEKLNMHDGHQVVPVLILEVTATKVKLDANHELAGKDLIFDIEIVEIMSDEVGEIEFTEILPNL